MPLTLLGEADWTDVDGQPIAWLAYLVCAAAAVVVSVTRPARRILPWPLVLLATWAAISATRGANALQAFLALGLLLAPPFCYLAAARSRFDMAIPLFRRLAPVWIVVLAVGFVLLGGPPAIGTPWFPAFSVVDAVRFSNRLLGIAMVTLFIVATTGRPTRRYFLVIAAAALGLAVASGSRMASLVLLLLVLTAPGLRVGWKTRTAVAAGLVLVASAVLSLPDVRQRWFVDEEGSIVDVMTLSPNLNATGRRELWLELVPVCNQRPLVGRGLGWSNTASFQLSDGRISQPHNEYLRLYCDMGLVGSALFWAVPVLVGVRAATVLRVRPNSAASVGALQFVVALLLLALTDNVLSAVIQFSAPAFVLFAWSDRDGRSVADRPLTRTG